MKIKESPSRKVFNVFNILLMLVIGFICIYPFLYVVFASFSDAAQFFQYNGVLLAPKGFSTAAYKEVFKNVISCAATATRFLLWSWARR